MNDIILKCGNDESLVLRSPKQSDCVDLLLVKNNVESAKLLGGTPRHFEQDDIYRWIEFHNSKDDEVLMVIEDLNSNTVIGHIGLYNIDTESKSAEIGILIGNPGIHGRGIGTKTTRALVSYAFNRLGLHRVYAYVIVENEASLRMFRKCGFQEEGILRDSLMKGGRYHSQVLLAVINDLL